MDAVILAAGRNRRLADHIADFHKPLIIGAGLTDSLVRRAVKLACWQGVDRPVVVASPANALEINEQLCDLSADIVVQREPAGPGDALRIGLSLNTSKPHPRVLVLLADNFMTDEDVSRVASMGTAVGVRRLPADEAIQYTWFDPDDQRWREKIQVPDRLAHGVDCWVGPFVGDRVAMQHVLRHALPINGEYAIGPYLSELTQRGSRVSVGSIDIGTIEAYLAYTRGEL